MTAADGFAESQQAALAAMISIATAIAPPEAPCAAYSRAPGARA